jgi:N-sulfoglucosamine sulfohydrolase
MSQPRFQVWKHRFASIVLLLFPTVLAFSAGSEKDTSTPQAARKNVLLLISDNHTAPDLGCAGHPTVKTPNLDALAARGTRFAHAFATTPSCGPSRAVIYTGLLTHANGQFTHPHSFHNGVLAKGVTTVFDMLKKDGYRTALLGKGNLGPRAGQYEIDLFDENPMRDLPTFAKTAEEFIREGGGRPFFVVLSTHDPQPTDKPADQRWKKSREPLPPRRIDPATVYVPSHLPDRPDVRESLAEYYENIERLDAGFGEALAMLKRTGHDADTLVMFFSDQGAAYPNGGYSHYDPGVAVPLIVVNPEARRRGVVSDAMVSLADITPTVLDWTGVQAPYPLHGRSLLPALEQEHAEGWDSIVLSHVMHEVTMYYPMRTLRDRRYKLIWNLCYKSPWQDALEVVERSPWAETWRRGDKFIGRRPIEKYLWRDPVELYDLQNDPDEVVNLADDPKYADLRRTMSEKLLARLRETGDNWLERYQLPMPGEQVKIGELSPPGYAPPRPKNRGASAK